MEEERKKNYYNKKVFKDLVWFTFHSVYNFGHPHYLEPNIFCFFLSFFSLSVLLHVFLITLLLKILLFLLRLFITVFTHLSLPDFLVTLEAEQSPLKYHPHPS